MENGFSSMMTQVLEGPGRVNEDVFPYVNQGPVLAELQLEPPSHPSPTADPIGPAVGDEPGLPLLEADQYTVPTAEFME